MTWEIILSIIGSLGGLELIKWVANRKTNSRIALAEAESAEFHHLQETNEWLQKQLQAKEERFAEQTDLVRQLNRDLLTSEKKIAEREVELAHVRCDDKPCPWRKPPNAFTAPPPNSSRETWHQKRLNEHND